MKINKTNSRSVNHDHLIDPIGRFLTFCSITPMYRGAQPYYVNTQMRMKNPWGGIKCWALGGNGKIIFHF